MRSYSPFFYTVYDQSEPVGVLGRGTHYSVLRLVEVLEVAEKAPHAVFYDFAVIWDADHDTRIIWILEQLYTHGLLQAVHVIGESRGVVTIVTRGPAIPVYRERVLEVLKRLPSDSFEVSFRHVGDLSEQSLIQSASTQQATEYIGGINATWQLGHKVAEYAVEPYQISGPQKPAIRNTIRYTDLSIRDVTSEGAKEILERDEGVTTEDLETLKRVQPLKPPATYKGAGMSDEPFSL